MVKRTAYGTVMAPISGIIMQNGTPEQPMLPGPYAGDYFNTLMIGFSRWAALYKAESPARASPSTSQCMRLAVHRSVLPGRLPQRRREVASSGARNQNLCGIGEFECMDGFPWAFASTASTRTSTSWRPSASAISGAPRISPGHLGSVALQPACRRDPGCVREATPRALQVRDQRTSPLTASLLR